MSTLTIEVNDGYLDKFLDALKQFPEEKVRISPEVDSFLHDKAALHQALSEVRSGHSEPLDETFFAEMDAYVDEVAREGR